MMNEFNYFCLVLLCGLVAGFLPEFLAKTHKRENNPNPEKVWLWRFLGVLSFVIPIAAAVWFFVGHIDNCPPEWKTVQQICVWIVGVGSGVFFVINLLIAKNRAKNDQMERDVLIAQALADAKERTDRITDMGKVEEDPSTLGGSGTLTWPSIIRLIQDEEML